MRIIIVNDGIHYINISGRGGAPGPSRVQVGLPYGSAPHAPSPARMSPVLTLAGGACRVVGTCWSRSLTRGAEPSPCGVSYATIRGHLGSTHWRAVTKDRLAARFDNERIDFWLPIPPFVHDRHTTALCKPNSRTQPGIDESGDAHPNLRW